MSKISTINDINTRKEEGKLLLSAIAILTLTVDSDKEPDEVLERINKIKDKIFD